MVSKRRSRTRRPSTPTHPARQLPLPLPDFAPATVLERAFPVVPVSRWTIDERSAGSGQLLTALGKWWGRKPLVLVRAVLLAALLPAEDADSLEDWWAAMDPAGGLRAYDPERVARARTLVARWAARHGRPPIVGDALCGGGSVPFEAARIGCTALASDLDPFAVLLTWGALAVVGGSEEVVRRVSEAQRRVFADVQRQVEEWGIERNEQGWVAEVYLYCHEVRDPFTGWQVPLAASWVIAEKSRVVARLVPDHAERRFAIEVVEGASAEELEAARAEATWVRGGLRCPVDAHGNWLPPEQRRVIPAAVLRGSAGLRLWANEDLVPRPEDVFQERLYCIRWYDPRTGQRFYRAATREDLERERRVLELLRERFPAWQAAGYVPSARIEPGEKTGEPILTRGWTHWHHLFHPRQLLLHGLLAERSAQEPELEARALSLMLGRAANWNSRLCHWLPDQIGRAQQTFYNQALNTFAHYAVRTTASLETAFCLPISHAPVIGRWHVRLADARTVDWEADIWVSDPGYGEAVRYGELAGFFRAWIGAVDDGGQRIEGSGEEYERALAECFTNLARRTLPGGLHVLFFASQHVADWQALARALREAGLVTRAVWAVETEPLYGVRRGRQLRHTLVLVLRRSAVV